jgi:large subunit ribosomal protein L16
MKYKKYFKLKYSNNYFYYDSIYSGSFGLKSVTRVNLTLNHLNSTVKSIKRVIKKKNFLIIRCNPFWSLTQKPRDVRMGRGKGSPALKVFPIRSGGVLFEIKGVDERLVIKAFSYCALRLPTKCIVVKKYDKRTDSIKGCW